MKENFLLLLLIVATTLISFAQKTITGNITDQESNPIANVSITVKGTDIELMSSDFGFYSVDLPKGSRLLSFQKLGYSSQEIKVKKLVEDVVMKISKDEFYYLSLYELMNVRAVGAVVRDLSFNAEMNTDNLTGNSNFETPASTEIITQETIEARGLKNIIEATENTVGIIYGYSPASPNSFSMRGFSGDHVKILYDGFSLGVASLNTRPLGVSNLEKIEILKGPITLAHGQGVAGGTINIISKKPRLIDRHTGKMNIAYGQFNRTLMNAELTGPISKKIVYRVDINRESSDGQVDNSNSKALNLNSTVLWQLSPKFKTFISFSYAQDDLAGYWGTPFVPLSYAEEPLDVVKTENDLVIDGALRNENYNVSDYLIHSNSVKFMIDTEWKWNEKVSNKTKFYYFQADRNWKNAENYTFDLTSEKIIRDRFTVDHDRELWGLISKFKLEGEIAGLDNVLGINLEYNENIFSRSVGFLNATIDSVDLKNPKPGEFGSVEARDDFFNEGVVALVADYRIALNSKFNVEVAGRLEKTSAERERYDFDGNPRPNQSLDETYIQTSYRVGAVYQFLKKSMIYGHYSLQHGSFSTDIATTALADVAAFTPSKIVQKEIGVKSTLFKNKVELSLALYEIDRSIEIEVNADITENKENSKGLEFVTKIAFSEKYKLGGSFAYTHACLEKYFDPNFGIDVTGNIPINVPDIIASVWTSYNTIIELPIEIGAGVRYVSERQANSENTITMSGYTLLNVFLAYTIDKYRLAFHVRNLTNEDYAPWSDQFYPNQVILGDLRTLELSFFAQF